MKYISIRLCVILLIILLVFPAEADWKSKLRRGAKNARKKVEKTRRSARDKIKKHVDKGRDSFSRKSKELQRRSNKTVRNAHESFKKASRHGRDSYNKTRKNFSRTTQRVEDKFSSKAREVKQRFGSRAAERVDYIAHKYGNRSCDQMVSLYQKYGSNFADRANTLITRHGAGALSNCKRVIDKYGQQVGSDLMVAYDRHGKFTANRLVKVFDNFGSSVGQRVKNTADITLGNVKRYMSDDENQKKAVDAVITTAIIYNRIDSEKKRITKNAINSAANKIIVEDRYGRDVSLNECVKDWVEQEAPYLRGTSIAEDPAEALTYGVIYNDGDYIYNEMKVIKGKDGEYRSIRDSAIYSAGLDADKTLSALEMADNLATLGDDEASPDDIVAAANTLQRIQSCR